MSRRFGEIVPATPGELEQFYLQVVDKLKGTSSTLEEVDQRSNWPGAPIVADLDRAIRGLADSAVAPLRAQISELEQKLRNQQGQSANIIAELERRIDSIEKSARF